jgi:nicotinamide-nucleotide amidase
MVGVPAVLLQQNGAVSDEVARAMAEGALHTANVDVAIAVTGIAGPGGATPDKPVGLVYIALAAKTCPTLVERHVFSGDRAEVRYQTVMRSLTLLNQFAA